VGGSVQKMAASKSGGMAQFGAAQLSTKVVAGVNVTTCKYFSAKKWQCYKNQGCDRYFWRFCAKNGDVININVMHDQHKISVC
jgi:hypothetical protein